MSRIEEAKLIEPSKKLREAYMEFDKEFREAGGTSRFDSTQANGNAFDVYVRQTQERAKGLNLPEGWVPCTSYWLVASERIIGACGLRHRLTEALRDLGGHIGYAIRPSERNKGYGTLMLRLALVEARKLGLKRVLITCNKENAPSARVIQKNGGVLESEGPAKSRPGITQRYWIELAEPDDSGETR